MKSTIKLLHDMLQAIVSIETYAVTSYDAFLEDDPDESCLTSLISSFLGIESGYC